MSVNGVLGAVGNTPLIRLQKLSDLLGRHIYGKAELLNPAGSIKDRAALGIVQDAEARGALASGVIVEGTAGNTGIGLAMIALARGYKAVIVLPDNQAPEKFETLRALRAEVIAVPATKFADPAHFYHTAKRIAEERGAFWANQFENTANADTHYRTTAPELWQQCGGKMDAFVLSSGTGGTIGGVSQFLKEKSPAMRVVLADPMGSGLYSYVKTGEIKSEGSSITEGIGIMRITQNFSRAKIDDAIQVQDAAVVAMAHWLLREEGLLVGSSSALNVWAAAKVALDLPAGSHVSTCICDGGQRYQSRLFNDTWLAEKSLLPSSLELRSFL